MDNGSEPATKQDISQLHSEMQHMYDDLVERIDDTQTKMLQAFYTFAESNQKRLTENERDTSGVKDRLAILESRVTEIEKRLNLPPAA
jgi:hypothetical protein